MDYSRNVMNKNSSIYLNYDYLMFPVNLSIVPEIIIGGDKFYSKSGYHVSLLCLEGLTKADQVKIFDFVQKYDLKIGKISNIYRLIIEGDQRSIVVRVRILGLKKLILTINKNFGYRFTNPPTHITLFTLKGQTGIGINTFKKYQHIGHKIDPHDIVQLKKSFNLI